MRSREYYNSTEEWITAGLLAVADKTVGLLEIYPLSLHRQLQLSGACALLSAANLIRRFGRTIDRIRQ